MKALTLWRPWPCAIFYLNSEFWKDIENRPRKPPQSVIGKRIAIHAGAHIESNVFGDWIEIIKPSPMSVLYLASAMLSLEKVRGIVGTVVIDSVCTPEETNSPWASGPYCLKLRDRRPLISPIPIGGKQGYWDLPPSVEREVKRREIKNMKYVKSNKQIFEIGK